MDAHNKSTMANVVGWIALIISIIALILAWTAFNNTSEENLGEMIQNQMQDTIQIEQPQQDGMNNTMNDTPNDGAVTPGTGGTMNDDATIQDEEDAVMPENTN